MIAVNNYIVLTILIFVVNISTASATDLQDSVEDGDIKSVRTIITQGKNVDKTSFFDKRTPLIIAVDKNEVEIARILINNGADIHKEYLKEKPIHRAARAGHVKMVELLLQSGEDINERGGEKRHTTHILFDL